MDDPVFKKRYQKYKLRVKLWEKDFKKKNGRVPSKYDIREASQEIRDSYKMYYKLKTSFLEDTLNDVLSEDDGFDVFEMTQTEDGVTPLDDSLTESINGGPNLPLDISTIVNSEPSGDADTSIKPTENFSNLSELPTPNAHINLINRDEDHVIRKFEAVETSTQNENAWGSSVSKKLKAPIKTSNTPDAKKPSFRTSLNPNKFQTGGSFAKRNPRKPLSRNSLNLSKDVNRCGSTIGDEQEALPDLETILIKKAQEYKAAAASAANLLMANERSKDTVKTQIDEGWLDRNAAQNGLRVPQKAAISTSIKTEQNNNATPAKKINYGLSNLDVSKFVTTPAPVKPAPVTPAPVTPAPLENEIISTIKKSPEDLKPLPPSPPAMIEQPSFVATKLHKKPVDSDSDSVVADSEDEQDPQEYRHIVKRRRVMPVGSETSLSQPTEPVAVASAAPDVKSTVIQKKDDGSDNESGKDFSVDEDEDASYVPEEPKSKRKKAIAKRTKPVKTEKLPKAEKKPRETKPKAEKKPVKPKAEKKPRAPKANTRTSAKAKASMEEELEEEEEQPLNPEELKYALALENGDITSAPRIKLTDLEKVDNMAQKYINDFGTTAPRAMPTRFVDEKRAAARRKLEEKIASGKLNENFVSINIEKKKYSRGKKSVNFSKYKKQQWKHKKHIAALSGPDMDMGGCDGGVLTCFTCGGVGHFARQCKVKGDTLLPLSAQIAEDPSPFPTLEEAQRMATQNALVVHGRNISQLPQATNAAIYQNDNKAETNDNDEKELEAAEEEEPTKQDNETSEISGESSHDSDSDADFNDIDFEELDAMIESSAAAPQKSPIKNYVGHKIPEEFLKKAGLDADSNTTASAKFGGVGPLYDLNADGSVKDVTPEVLEALHMFGHTNFRKGQDRAVMRILSGLSTLVTLSTGSGKSLCYQLAAYLYSRHKKSITLVISPLVSLMEDQVTGVPHFLRAHCMHTNQTLQQRLKIQQLIADGEVDILLVSPEAVVSGERSTGFGALLRQLPPIAFACIDEAHCVSQWSHNFRPSYLMICKVLKKNLGVNTVLGLTATATLPTRISIINHLGIEDGERGIISDIPLPDNLVLSISKDDNRDAALLSLLNSPRFEPCQSVIIYCTRRDECERIAGFIRTCMQDRKSNAPENAKKKRRRVNWHAEPYHAGMPASRRRTIQNAFMKNELRIVVATIAFGMGINKPDIRAIIHYNMPRNFESYVQEIGRAGRDGLISHCHLFLATNDQNELRRHIYSNSIDRHVIRKLLQRLFVPCACDKVGQASSSSQEPMETDSSESLVTADASDFGSKPARSRQHICPGHEIGFSIEKTVEALDIPSENISTLLCYMELDTRWSMQVLSAAYINAKVISYGGSKYLKHAAKECPPLAMAIALQIQNKSFDEKANIIEFSVVDIAAAIGWNSGVVKYQLKNLEWVQVNGYPKRSPISVTFSDLGFRLKAPGDFTTEEIDDALDTLYNRSVKQETTQLIQLQYVYQGLSAVAYNTYAPCSSATFSNDRSEQLKGIIRNYFQNDYPKDLQLEIEQSGEPDECIVNDIHALINIYPDNTFSGRNVARIFHGISSPNYPAVIWGRCKFWRAHTKTNFNRILQLANAEIVKRRM